ncbi:MAG: M24 family metallopeptidase [Candidatus Rokuibacteriota bacterium]
MPPLDLPFDLDEYRGRLRRVQAAMAERNLDLLMVHTPENSYYLTGYRSLGYYSYTVLFVPGDGDPIHLNRAIEKTAVEGTSWVPNQNQTIYPDTEHYLDATIRVMRTEGLDRAGRIGIDKQAWYLTIGDYESLQERLPHATFVDAAMLVDDMRIVKSPAEQAYSRRAGAIVSDAMRHTIGAIRPGVTESELQGEAYKALVSGGSEYQAVQPLVASGVRATMAHVTAEGRRVEQGDIVYLEMAASVKRYHAALLRCAWVGKPPAEAIEITDACRRALDAGIAAMKPGVPCEEVDRACRAVVEEAGYGASFRHKAGYSIGIGLPPDWSEARAIMLRGGEKRALRPGMIFHILPACFEYQKHCAGVSATVLITDTGHEVLTNLENNLFVV